MINQQNENSNDYYQLCFLQTTSSTKLRKIVQYHPKKTHETMVVLHVNTKQAHVIRLKKSIVERQDKNFL